MERRGGGYFTHCCDTSELGKIPTTFIVHSKRAESNTLNVNNNTSPPC
jgi:hypothetical protein